MAAEPHASWIEWLFQSGIGLGCFDPPYALFRQANARSEVELLIASEPDGARQLRQAALLELRSGDDCRIERALFYLIVVGEKPDIAEVEALRNDARDTIRKGTRACRFELTKR